MIIVRAMFNVLNFDGRTAVFGGPSVFVVYKFRDYGVYYTNFL